MEGDLSTVDTSLSIYCHEFRRLPSSSVYDLTSRYDVRYLHSSAGQVGRAVDGAELYYEVYGKLQTYSGFAEPAHYKNACGRQY